MILTLIYVIVFLLVVIFFFSRDNALMRRIDKWAEEDDENLHKGE